MTEDSVEVPPELARILENNGTITLFYGSRNLNNIGPMHIRAVVDDVAVVYSVWSRRYKNWVYGVYDLYRLVDKWNDAKIEMKGGDSAIILFGKGGKE